VRKTGGGREGLEFWSLSSSSVHGNAYLVRSRGAVVLVDCGVGIRRLERQLEGVGVPPSSVDALFISHEHRDHLRALMLANPFSIKHSVPTYGPEAVVRHLEVNSREGLTYQELTTIGSGSVVAVGDLLVTGVGKPHDTEGSLGYLIAEQPDGGRGGETLGIATDLGHVPPEVADAFTGLDHLIFESNHDDELELRSNRPRQLVDRVMGNYGHLSNEQAGRALRKMVRGNTRTVVLSHLSLDCNEPSLALKTVGRHLAEAGYGGRLAVAPASGEKSFKQKTFNRRVTVQ